jgi:osmoprotectant transport system ATP-binding protein
MLQLEGVGKRYGDFVALHPTDLSLEPGETTVLIGSSGCGKSTILRLMIGLIEPSSGRVLFDGEVLCPANLLQIRRRMGYVIQDGGLFPHLTARDNILLLARHLQQDPDPLSQRLAELQEMTRFPSEGLDKYPAELSGGQRQRVSLMRALILDPDVLLLDEPMGALDPLVRASLQTDLRDIFRQLQKTVVTVTHDMGEAAYLGQQIVLLRQGAIVQQGSLDDLQQRPASPFVTEFLQAQRSLVSL